MGGDFRIVFEEDGFPRELVTAAERERAVRDELLTADMEVTVYRTGATPKVTRVGDIEELQPFFKADEPEPEPERAPKPLRAHDEDKVPVPPRAPPPPPEAVPPASAAADWDLADAEADRGHFEDDRGYAATPSLSLGPDPSKVVAWFVVGGILVFLVIIGLASGRRTPASSGYAGNGASTAADSGMATEPAIPTGPAPVSREEMAASAIRYTIRQTNVRAGPHSGSNIITLLPRGEQVQGVSVPSLSDPNHTWLKITHGPHAGYFVFEPNVSANLRPALDTSVSGQWTVRQAASVYAEPSNVSAVLGTASPDQRFTVFGLTPGGMMEVSREGGGIGYIERSAFDEPSGDDQGMSNSAAPEGYDEVSVWEHNGALLRLQASGQRRMFVYSQPRAGVPAAPGDILFHGERRGPIYRGTAYLFSSQCGRIGFAVEGNVHSDDRQVTLHGNAPRRDRNCRVIGSQPNQLVFRYVRNQ